MMKSVALLIITLSLGACGYHLVGHGGQQGVLAADVQQLQLQGSDAEGKAMAEALLPMLAAEYQVSLQAAKDDTSVARLRVVDAAQQVDISAYDAAGIAIQYRMTLRGAIQVIQPEADVWQSREIVVSGDVFASGDAIAVEAAKARTHEDLLQEWATQAMNAIQSGF